MIINRHGACEATKFLFLFVAPILVGCVGIGCLAYIVRELYGLGWGVAVGAVSILGVSWFLVALVESDHDQ